MVIRRFKDKLTFIISKLDHAFWIFQKDDGQSYNP